MKVTSEIVEAREARRQAGGSWGLVPTMGFLHDGHLALVRRAREENDHVAVTIFVNPAQFNQSSDFEHYPRDLERDLDLLREAGTDLVFTPGGEAMYPVGYQTYVELEQLSRPLEGASRPGHFRGVATVVTKLFNILTPTRAYFGQKDAQQVVVVEQLVRDLDFGLEIVRCPTEREADGLAMSSRNARLTAAEREAAPVVYRALLAAREAFEEGERAGESLRQRMREVLAAEPLARIDYVSVADPITLAELDTVDSAALLSLAAFFGEVRLIDNILLAAS